jgi:hypothetical protein
MAFSIACEDNHHPLLESIHKTIHTHMKMLPTMSPLSQDLTNSQTGGENCS